MRHNVANDLGGRPGRVSIAALCAVFMVGGSACTRTYYYGREAPPPIEGPTLYVDHGDGAEARSIKTIRVSSASSPGVWRPVSPDEMALLMAGESPDDLVEVRVDNTATIWRDWGLGAFGVTFALTAGLFASTVGFEPEGSLDLSLGLLIAT
ncbi:MAG TPA: hypothetical protein PK095_22555, partial [Myxococcota bacterium]|nr:hypothetical protein [Myxococcota bacterium]